jgi:hypothetical protein
MSFNNYQRRTILQNITKVGGLVGAGAVALGISQSLFNGNYFIQTLCSH